LIRDQLLINVGANDPYWPTDHFPHGWQWKDVHACFFLDLHININ